MPKKSGKSAVPVDDEETIKRKSKRVKEIVDGKMKEVNIEPDAALVNKIYDSQGWPRANGPEPPEMTMKLIFAGENREGSSSSDKISSVAVKQFGKALVDACPLHCNVKALAFWRLAVEDDGVKGIVEFVAKTPKPDVWPWEGLVNLELIECNLSAVSCQLLADELARNCALKSLVLDFNPIGDTGASILAQGLKRNSVLSTLKLAYCGITSAAAQPIADGLIQGSKIKILDLKGNRLGIHTSRSGQSLQGYAMIPMFAALRNTVVETESSLQAKAKPRPEKANHEDKGDQDTTAADLRGAPSDAHEGIEGGQEASTLDKELKVTHGAKADVEGFTPSNAGNLLATAGEWKGWELYIRDGPLERQVWEADGEGAEENARRLMALTETLQAIDLTDNFIQEDVSVVADRSRGGRVGIGAPEPDRVALDDPSMHLTVASPMAENDTIVCITNLAIEVGRAHIGEGCYCRVGAAGREEVVQVGAMHKECDAILQEDMDLNSAVLHVSSRHAQALDLVPGACLVLGNEVMRYKATKASTASSVGLLVARAQCGSKTHAHTRGSTAKRLTYLEITRGTCGSAPLAHSGGDKLVRISQIAFFAKVLRNNASLEEVRLEHNNIEATGAEALRLAVARLQCFTISGKNMSKELFNELYKDGGGKKGKKGKKKK